MWNETDYDRAMNKIAALEAAELDKAAFVAMGPNAPQPAPPPMDPAMAGGGAPVDPATGMPMDPAMMGGAAPVDPAMMGGAPVDPAMAGGGMPVDPAMMGADPAAMGGAPVDPAMAGAPPADAGADPYDMIVQAVRQVMQEMGVTGDGDKEKPKKKEGTSSKIEKLEAMLGTIMTTLGLPIPEGDGTDSEGGDSGGGGSEGGASDTADAQAATGFGMDSGAPSEAPPMAAGPLDPNASMAMGQLDPGGMPQPAQPPKTAGFRPLDDLSEVRRMAETIKRIRASR